MEAKTVKLSKIKPNHDNPRVLKDWKYNKLKKSIQDFPEMMELREIVVDENMTILGGNMRYRVMQDLGIKECPVKVASGLSEEQKKEFIIKDNLAYGEWDMDAIANNWEANILEDWGFDEIKVDVDDLPKNEISDDDFENELKKVNDDNCKLPIVPEFFEDHECFIIPCHNEIDIKFIRDLFDLNENHKSTSGDKKIRKTNVIDIEKLKKWSVR